LADAPAEAPMARAATAAAVYMSFIALCLRIY
jgi:hypothetical protein